MPLRHSLQRLNAAVKGGPGHAEISRDLRGRLAAVDEADRVSDLAIGEDWAAATEVFTGCSTLGDRVADPFSFDIKLHLSESGHNSEDHRSHRRRGVDVAPSEIQDAQAGAAISELVRERKHVLRRPAQTVEGRDHQSVAIMKRDDSPVELRPRSSRTRNASVYIEVIMSNSGG